MPVPTPSLVDPRTTALDPDTVVTVEAWHDPVVESHRHSHPTASEYTLVWWTPILGPTATLMAHRFAGAVDRDGQATYALVDLAATFGMGQSVGRVRASLARLERFRVARVHATTVQVRLALPPLTERQIGVLPGYLADEYRRLHGRG